MSYSKDLVTSIKNYSNRVDSSFTKQQISTTLVELNSTRMTYTPDPNASSVVYEICFFTAWNPDPSTSFLNLRLQYSADASTWTTLDNTKLFLGNGPGSADYNWHVYQVLFHLEPWTGSRYLRLAGRSHSTASELILGRSYLLSGEGPGVSPMISVYSIVD